MSYRPETYWPERFKRQGDTYVARGGRANAWTQEKAWIEPLFAHLPRSGTVLDFGCGPGRFRPALESHGLEYVGVDLIPVLGTEPVAEAMQLDRFDCAVAVMVLQHIVEEGAYLEVIRGLHATLRPGGTLLVVDHAHLERPHAHMCPRGPEGVLQAARWSSHALIGDVPRHWAGVFVR